MGQLFSHQRHHRLEATASHFLYIIHIDANFENSDLSLADYMKNVVNTIYQCQQRLKRKGHKQDFSLQLLTELKTDLVQAHFKDACKYLMINDPDAFDYMYASIEFSQFLLEPIKLEVDLNVALASVMVQQDERTAAIVLSNQKLANLTPLPSLRLDDSQKNYDADRYESYETAGKSAAKKLIDFDFDQIPQEQAGILKKAY